MGRFSLNPEFFFLSKHHYTMILQRIRIIVEDDGFELWTSAPEIWGATTNEPLHLHLEMYVQ